jgi:hypothetical protein
MPYSMPGSNLMVASSLPQMSSLPMQQLPLGVQQQQQGHMQQQQQQQQQSGQLVGYLPAATGSTQQQQAHMPGASAPASNNLPNGLPEGFTRVQDQCPRCVTTYAGLWQHVA